MKGVRERGCVCVGGGGIRRWIGGLSLLTPTTYYRRVHAVKRGRGRGVEINGVRERGGGGDWR